MTYLFKLRLTGCIILLSSSLFSQTAVRPLTVTDAIDASRLLFPYQGDSVLLSPDEKRYLFVVQRGDVQRNGSWVELVCGNTVSLESASRARTVARLFSKSTARADDLIKNLRWLNDSEHVVFLWDGGEGPPQILELDVRSRRIRKLTAHPAPIVDYDVSGDGQAIVFTAQADRDSSELSFLRQRGFAVTGLDIWPILRGDVDGWNPRLHYETFVRTNTREAPRKVGEPNTKWATQPELLQLSPDGRYAVAVRPAGQPHAGWEVYTEHIFKDVYLPSARQHTDSPNWIRQYVIIDMHHRTAHPLWDAPQSPYGKVVWSPDSRSLLIGPTFLPPVDSDVMGLAGRAVVTVDIATGHYTKLPIPDLNPKVLFCPVRWSDEVIALGDVASRSDTAVRLRFKKEAGTWREASAEDGANSQPAVRFELRQDPNTPPALYAVETKTGRERMIRDLNPQFRKHITFGRSELVHWTGSDGKPWTGMLYYPLHYSPGQYYPFVIQTHGYSANEFSLDGSFTTLFAARPLANRDIAVLQVGGPDSGDELVLATPQEPRVYTAGIEGAIQHFEDIGLADRKSVGIVGFSRTGWIVEYLLTHSRLRLAAAEVADNIDGSYLQYVLGNRDLRTFYESDKGAPPFGKGLEAWLREAPGFNADKIHTPLRLEVDSGPITNVLFQWEMFSNLQYLGKPVELFVIPDVEHGSHVLQNPLQRLASQGGTVDWFTFWLKGEEDSDPAKTGQYRRWRELRRLQEQNEK